MTTRKPPILLHTWLRNIAIWAVILYLEALTIEAIADGPATTWYWQRVTRGRRQP
jgi:hypothetical protein